VGAEAIALCRRIAAGRRSADDADIATLRSSIASLPALAAPRSEAEAIWLAYRERFRQDVLARNPRRFLRWPVIRPMYRRDAPYIGQWLDYLRAHPEWQSRWQSAVRESAVGDPRPYYAYWPSSGNLLSQAYHLCRFEDVTGARLADVQFLLEFGGGYGALCRVLRALGFRGTYAIFDFPEFSALQRFYLRAHGLPAAAWPRREPGRPDIVTLSTLGELDELLESQSPDRAAFVALWSLSEAPLPLRDAVMTRVAAFDMFAVGYQARFGDVDNMAWFRMWHTRPEAHDIEWHDLPLQQQVGSVRHLFGARRRDPADEARRRVSQGLTRPS
jgi:hypothetical protein